MRKKKWLRGVALSIGALVVVVAVSGLVSCADLFGSNGGGGGGGDSDGIVTISLTGAGDKDGLKLGVSVVEQGGHPEGDQKAGGEVQIADGKVEFTTAGDWKGNGGTTYDVYMLIQEKLGEPGEGDLLYCEFPCTYTQNGDFSLSLTYSDDFGGGLGVQLTDFDRTQLPGESVPSDGDCVFSAWVYDAGTDEGDLENPDYLLGTSGHKGIDGDGKAEVHVMTHAGDWEPGSGLWVGDQGESYDVYYQIDYYDGDTRTWWIPPNGNSPEEIQIHDGTQFVTHEFNGANWVEYDYES